MSEYRPSPDDLLKQVQEEELQEKRGKLKIYLGASPGVGKTYSMLQDAKLKRAQGLDVVIGIAESHGRKEIQDLCEGLEILPKQEIEYRGKQLEEFDLDAALKRNPGLILIDEMAHTNAPGLRHNKRWQDIKELLDRGIDVYTTLNVQHVESLNDIIAQITHAVIKETVPDSMLEMATTVELIDLPVDDLLKRLQQGKVYIPAQAELAKERFFRKGNLIALRELALRATAQYVGAQALSYRHGQGIQRIWPTKEKILVCVGAGTESIKLIRAARRLAASLQAEWIAVHVDAPRLRLSAEEHNAAIQNLRLAEQLGAETRILSGFDVVKEILDFAHEQNITQIVIWKHIRSRWRDLFFKNLADEVVRGSGEINVNIITGQPEDTVKIKKKHAKEVIPWRAYGIALGVVALCTVIDVLLFPILSESNLIMIYLLGVSSVALFGRLGPSVLCSTLSVLCYDFFFIIPYYSFSVAHTEYFITLLIMLVVSQIISNLTILARRQAIMARQAANRTYALHTLSRQLASTRGIENLLEVTVRYIGELFDSEVLALLPTGHHLVIRAHYRTHQELSIKEQAVVRWVFDMGKTAGLGTDTLSFSDAIYVPMLTSQGSVGVLKVHPREPQHLLTPEQMQLLDACANQVALALEVERLHDLQKKSEAQLEADRVRSHLVEAISHDLHTPLKTLMQAANSLVHMGNQLDALRIERIGSDIYQELEQLNHLIQDLSEGQTQENPPKGTK